MGSEGRAFPFVRAMWVREAKIQMLNENQGRIKSESHVSIVVGLMEMEHRDRLKCLYMVARNFFLLLLNFSAWP